MDNFFNLFRGNLVILFIILFLFAFTARIIYRVYLYSKTRNLIVIFFILGSLYPIGKAWQFSLVPPEIFRFYLADVGFIPGLAISLSGLFFGKIRFDLLPKFSWAAIIIALSTEIVQMLSDSPKPLGKMRAQGDFIDLLIFCSMGIISVYLALKMKSLAEAEVAKKTKKKRNTNKNHS